MYRAQHPARQLNSKAIKDAVSSYVLPTVQSRFCIVSANCVWRVQSDAESMAKAWELVCEKRCECDKALESVPGVAFFFSSISTCEAQKSKKANKNPVENECGGEDEEDDIMSSQRTFGEVSTSSAINTAVEKGRFPAINYWLAFESPNGATVSLVKMHRQLLECEVEICTKILPAKHGGHFEIVKRLCSVLKDHTSTYMANIVNDSFKCCFHEAIQDVDEGDSFIDAEEELRERPLRFVLVNPSYAKEMGRVLKSLVRAGLQLDVEGMDNLSYDVCCSVPPKQITTDQCTQLINDVEILMSKLGYALYEGEIYKKVKQARYTYSYKCDVSSFIGTLEGNEFFRSRLVRFGDKVKERLKNPKSQLIRQLKILHDLIEVNDGWCLSISQRRFVKEPMSDDQVGNSSPRAYFNCNHETTPDAKFFREILQNSLSHDQVKEFCNDFLNLFKFHGKRHKEKVTFCFL